MHIYWNKLWLAAIMGAVMLFSSCGRGDVPSLENGRMSIAFDAATGWPVENRPDGCETLLPDHYNLQFRMEQARALVYGMQPTIANYHAFLNQARCREMDFALLLARTRMQYLDYLLYGSMERAPEMTIPTTQANISKVSIYAARDGKSAPQITKEIPLLYTGMWKSPEGKLALFIVNIGDEPLSVSFSLGVQAIFTTIPARDVRVLEYP